MAQALQEEEHFGVLFIEQQHTIGLFAVPTGSTGLLDVALQAAAGGVVDDRSHIFAVNAHAESAGGGDDVEFTVLELPEAVSPSHLWELCRGSRRLECLAVEAFGLRSRIHSESWYRPERSLPGLEPVVPIRR